ncbi:MAG: TetR/AcrR family transcriptional regulator [Bryobacterales bacterium]|nr:TetR/AcrR family transcriptional regulator [Bryobacterales bacterium]
MFKRETPKAAATAHRILEAALDRFRSHSFDSTSMRDIAKAAGVATGAAYYYYESKEALVMAFYQAASNEMQPLIQAALNQQGSFEDRLRRLIEAKLNYFEPNRGVLRALLRSGIDPKHPLSPFSDETKPIRDTDLRWFEKLIETSDLTVPADLRPELPGLLWMFQMGVIYLWVTDESPGQRRTRLVLELGAKAVTGLLRISNLPFTGSLRRQALDLIQAVKGVE